MTTITRGAAKSSSRTAARDGGRPPWPEARGDGPVAVFTVAVRPCRRWQKAVSAGRALQ